MSNKEKLAYLAGIVDGEGTIRIKRDTWQMRNGFSKSPLYHEIISIKMSTPEPLQMMKEEFGGSLYKEKRINQSKFGFKTNKVMWVYQCSDASAARACGMLLPYLRVKDRQAEICLELRRSKESKLARKRGNLGGRKKGKGRPMPKQVLDLREKLWLQIKEIHQGGKIG